jgi:hypothetical protein
MEEEVEGKEKDEEDEETKSEKRTDFRRFSKSHNRLIHYVTYQNRSRKLVKLVINIQDLTNTIQELHHQFFHRLFLRAQRERERKRESGNHLLSSQWIGGALSIACHSLSM